MKKIGRNELCPCGSGKKYKKCCIGKEIKEVEIDESTQDGNEILLADEDVAEEPDNFEKVR